MERPSATGSRKSKTSGSGASAAFATSTVGIKPAGIFRASGMERVALIRQGIPAAVLTGIGKRMNMPQDRLYSTLRLPRATMDRKIKTNDNLSVEQAERVIGLERLIGQVETIVAESGNPVGFDAERWLGEWLTRPHPALNGEKPAQLMDTMSGQDVVSRLLAQSQSGAYA